MNSRKLRESRRIPEEAYHGFVVRTLKDPKYKDEGDRVIQKRIMKDNQDLAIEDAARKVFFRAYRDVVDML